MLICSYVRTFPLNSQWCMMARFFLGKVHCVPAVIACLIKKLTTAEQIYLHIKSDINGIGNCSIPKEKKYLQMNASNIRIRCERFWLFCNGLYGSGDWHQNVEKHCAVMALYKFLHNFCLTRFCSAHCQWNVSGPSRMQYLFISSFGTEYVCRYRYQYRACKCILSNTYVLPVVRTIEETLLSLFLMELHGTVP